MSSSSRSSSSSRAANDLIFDEIDLDRYSDSPWDRDIDVAVSALTEIGVLRGNDDGTFRPSRTLNRAEFVQIVMRLLNDDTTVSMNCFPDVRPSDWFAEPVCQAKAAGIIRGNARPGVAEALWRFEPSRDVQYEEAVKVLVKLYALPINGDEEGADWYVPFIKAASDAGLSIDGLEAGDRITRGEMARLTVAFAANESGQLDELRDAEENRSSRSSSSRTSSSSSTSSSRTSSSSSRSSNPMGSGTFDPLTDTSARSNILVLGETSPILAGVKFFSNAEPVDVDTITVDFVSGVDSIASLLIYDSEGELLGTATSVGGSMDTFRATIPNGRYELPRREDSSIYIRARLKSEDNGGESGENVEVDSVTVAGTGVWSNDSYTSTSTDDFNQSRTALGIITAVTNAASSRGVLATGSERLLGEYRFTARSPESGRDVKINTLSFSIDQSGGVTLSNVFLRVEGSDVKHTCTVSGNTVTCNSIPESIGVLDDSRTIRVYADVNVPSGNNTTLRLSLNDPGSPNSAGAVTWTDGVTVFTWLPLSQPLAGGTTFE